MKNKILVTIVALIIALPLIGGCGRVSPSVGVVAPAMGHPDDIRFENCLACHVGDQLDAKPLPHTGMGFTNNDCVKAGCHKLQSAGGVTLPPTTSQPPISTTQLPTSATQPPTTPVSTTAVSSTPPGTSATTSSTSATTPPPTSATTSAGKVLNLSPKSPLKSVHPDSVKTMCLFCHAAGAGALQFPLPPTWDGTAGTPGPWVVTPGSPADHTGRSDPATCLQAGCHVIA
jgi:hypothetical protein